MTFVSFKKCPHAVYILFFMIERQGGHFQFVRGIGNLSLTEIK